ncbi:MAG: hypothetical protein DWQ07_16655 [Chloroflexi bacterium]|nr:MAG: hypothetical protein DWQ07_16655 [Chloroflexota bacterium]MBL1195383.1 hypothetical protein [Chloroflexota bacterium]NOH12666.1 hypothetical protein [Chloroflexota bacterium]
MQKAAENGVGRILLWIGGLALLPLLFAGIYILLVSPQERDRFDAQYFDTGFQQKYAGFADVLEAGQSLASSPEDGLYRELTGLTVPGTVPENSLNGDVRYFRLPDDEPPDYRIIRYYEHLGKRSVVHYYTEVDGRWVLVPRDAYFYYDTGLWLQTWMPLTVTWWIILSGVLLTLFLRHRGLMWRRLWIMPRVNDTG